jgi:hypothetical protein
VREAIYSVHTTRPDDIGAVEIVFRTEREAIAYAMDRSTDWRIVATAVTRFTIGELADPAGSIRPRPHTVRTLTSARRRVSGSSRSPRRRAAPPEAVRRT